MPYLTEAAMGLAVTLLTLGFTGVKALAETTFRLFLL
jgi:hypothetical protein